MSDNKLQKWALIAEITSAAVVVISIVFLIFEIRSNTESMQSAGLQSISERTQELTLNIITDAGLAEIADQYLGSPTSDLQTITYLVAVLKIGEESFLQYRNGFLTEEVWQSRSSYVLMHLQNEIGVRNFEFLKETGNFVSSYMEWLEQAAKERYDR